MLTIEQVAQVAHEAHRAYCERISDFSQPLWENASAQKRANRVATVKYNLAHPDAQPKDSHDAWMAAKVAAGWSYGMARSVESKRHPNLVAFKDLPKDQQAKSTLCLCVTLALRDRVNPDEMAALRQNSAPAPESVSPAPESVTPAQTPGDAASPIPEPAPGVPSTDVAP